jgi:type II secretory pathway component PulF
MAKHSAIFSTLYISMIRVGETGGILEQTTTQLAGLLKRDEQVKSNLWSASFYPIFLLVIGLCSVILVLTWILPRILATITGGIAALPLPTRMLLGMSDFIKGYGVMIAVAAVAGGFIFRQWKATEDGRFAWDRFKLNIPVLGSVLRSIAVGRFARTLGELTRGGITILQALAVVRDTLGNEVLARDIDEVIEKVRTGSPLAEPLRAGGNFPQLMVQIVSVGEQTGKLDEMLLGAAQTFDEEADTAINRFMSVFPVALILILAVIIGFIIAATLLPIIIMELGASGG